MENLIDIDISNYLSCKLREYSIIKDEIGESPAKVYKLVGSDETLYLKYSQKKLKMTTYCVHREMEVMKWLNGKINVPKIVFYENYQENDYMLMTVIKGTMLEECDLSHSSYIKYIVKALKELQSIDIKDCPFESNIDFRLTELRYLIENELCDMTLINNWDELKEFSELEGDFSSAEELYTWLCDNKPKEDFVFSHGDIGGSNIFLNKKEIGFIDLGRAGKADKWYDIAFCIRDIREWDNGEKYVDEFFSLLGIEPDWNKIKYYILLDELF